MKLKNVLFSLILLTAFASEAFSQNYPLVTIRDIQYIADSTLIRYGDTLSRLNGDTVRVRGVVMVRPIVNPSGDRRSIIYTGARWQIMIQDSLAQIWGGINLVQNDTTSANSGTYFDLVDTAQIVEFTGVISEYFTTTQFNLLLNPVTPINVIRTLPKRPDPLELQVTDFMQNGVLRKDAEKYEGMYVTLPNVITNNRNSSSGVFKFSDAFGNTMNMYDQSGYFTKRAHRLTGLTTYDAPADGSSLNYIRGIISTRTDGYYISPLYPGDILVGATPPNISSVARNIGEVALNTPITVTSKIVDFDGSVTSAKIFYRKNRTGAHTEVALTRSVTDTTIFSGVIPGQAVDSTLVDYFVWAQDNSGKITLNPQDTARNRFFYIVLSRPLKIQDVAYSPFGSGFSGFNNFRTTLTGVVTADTTDVPGWGTTPLRVTIQNGSTPWSGIWINGLQVLPLKRGDNVTVTGKIVDNFGVKMVDSLTSVVVNSTNNAVPAPIVVPTNLVGALTNGTVSAEQYENVLVEYDNVKITNINADGAVNFGEMLVADGSNVSTRVELQDGNHQYHNGWEAGLPGILVQANAKIEKLKGILYYSFSNYKLTPRKNDDFINYAMGVNDDGQQVNNYALNQNYPNPFNPNTIIEYSIAKEGSVSIQIYNVLGQVVKTLYNGEQIPGTYKVIFDGRDLPSGVYLYSIKTGDFSSVKKMMLLK